MAKRVLDHAAVRVADVRRSRQFYEELLGFATVPRPELGIPGVWYGLGGSQLHLIEMPAVPGGGLNPTDPHFAVEVDDLPALRARLEGAGCEILAIGDQQMWVRDPDGYTVELRAPAAMR